MHATMPIFILSAIALCLGACAPAGGESAREDSTVDGEMEKRDSEEHTVPESTSGQDIVGEKLPIDELRWVKGGAEAADRPKATLVRWWTNTCPYCEASLPVVESLREEFGERGLACKTVYHPKPPRDVPDAVVIEGARERGFTGPVAIDPQWDFLREHYLGTGQRRATSVAFLLDDEGVIRFVHGGPVIGTAGEFKSPEIEEEYERLRQAIQALLAEA